MLPWNYGFHWNAATMVFMGAFYTVLAIVATTIAAAGWRAYRDLRARKAEAIRWHSDFHDLTARDRACRHALTGEFQRRECPNAFDCRECRTHVRLAERSSAAASPEPEDDILGMSFPSDRLYHRGHTWVRREPDGLVTVGLDDLGRRLLGSPESVELPRPGQRIRVNGAAWSARKRGADVRILSPVDGEVVETGGPDGEFYLKVKPESQDLRHLLCPREIRPWLLREMERLQLALTAEGAAPTLADGGAPVADIAASCPEADWDAVCGQMFLHP